MNILIAENESALVGVLQRGFEAEHYAVDVAGSAHQAIPMLQGREYHTAIIDLDLPPTRGHRNLGVRTREISVLAHPGSNKLCTGGGLRPSSRYRSGRSAAETFCLSRIGCPSARNYASR